MLGTRVPPGVIVDAVNKGIWLKPYPKGIQQCIGFLEMLNQLILDHLVECISDGLPYLA
jgi:hypothetical protein